MRFVILSEAKDLWSRQQHLCCQQSAEVLRFAQDDKASFKLESFSNWKTKLEN
jgi:hypothetical protein